MSKPKRREGTWLVKWTERYTYYKGGYGVDREEAGHSDYHKSKEYTSRRGMEAKLELLRAGKTARHYVTINVLPESVEVWELQCDGEWKAL